MRYCTNCGAPVADEATFCTQCGAPVNPGPQAQGGVPPYGARTAYPTYVDPHDHTSEFTPEDISQNKVLALAVYLLGTVGVIIGLLGGASSPYVGFHVRQSLKITITEVLLIIVTALLCWTIIVPLLGGLSILVLFVLRIIAFFQICSGKAKEVPIISSLGFLK